MCWRDIRTSTASERARTTRQEHRAACHELAESYIALSYYIIIIIIIIIIDDNFYTYLYCKQYTIRTLQ